MTTGVSKPATMTVYTVCPEYSGFKKGRVHNAPSHSKGVDIVALFDNRGLDINIPCRHKTERYSGCWACFDSLYIRYHNKLLYTALWIWEWSHLVVCHASTRQLKQNDIIKLIRLYIQQMAFCASKKLRYEVSFHNIEVRSARIQWRSALAALVCALQSRHNRHDGLANHRRLDCVLNRLFRRRSKKTSKLRVTGLCEGNSPVSGEYPHKGPVTRKIFPFDDAIMISNNHIIGTPVVWYLVVVASFAYNRLQQWNSKRDRLYISINTLKHCCILLVVNREVVRLIQPAAKTHEKF